MRLGHAGSSGGTGAWTTSWINYKTSYSALPISGGTAGTRWVCVQFRDLALNSSSVARDTVIFDNPPTVDNSRFWSFGAAYTLQCSVWNWLALIPYVADDADSDTTIQITHVWTGGSTYPGTTNLSSQLSADKRSLEVYVSGTGTATDYFTVRDNHGLERQGHFEIRAYC